MTRFLVRLMVSIVACYVVLLIGLSFLGAIAFASPGSNWSADIGPIPLFGAHSEGAGSTFSVSWGVLLVAILLGVFNAAAAAALAARRADRPNQDGA